MVACIDLGLEASEKHRKFCQEMQSAATDEDVSEVLSFVRGAIRKTAWATNPIKFCTPYNLDDNAVEVYAKTYLEKLGYYVEGVKRFSHHRPRDTILVEIDWDKTKGGSSQRHQVPFLALTVNFFDRVIRRSLHKCIRLCKYHKRVNITSVRTSLSFGLNMNPNCAPDREHGNIASRGSMRPDLGHGVPSSIISGAGPSSRIWSFQTANPNGC